MRIWRSVRAKNQAKRKQKPRRRSRIHNRLELMLEIVQILQAGETESGHGSFTPNDNCSCRHADNRQNKNASLPIGNSFIQQQRSSEGRAKKMQIKRR